MQQQQPSKPPAFSDGSVLVDTGHSDIVHDAKANFYGQLIATCSSDHSIRVWERSSRRNSSPSLVKELKGHSGPVWGLDWCHPMHGGLLASCSYDRTVRIWRNECGAAETIWTCVHIYDGHDASVDCVAFGPWILGLVLASGCAHGSICVLRRQQPEDQTNFFSPYMIPNAHGMGVNAIAWCENQFLGRPNQPIRFASAGSDGLIKVWRASNNPLGLEEWSVESVLGGGHDDWVRDLRWIYPTPLVKTLRIASVGQDKRLVIWEMTDDENSFLKTQAIAFDDVLWSIDTLPHDNVLVVSGRDNKIHLVHENEGSFARIQDPAGIDELNTRTADDDRENRRQQLEI